MVTCAQECAKGYLFTEKGLPLLLLLLAARSSRRGLLCAAHFLDAALDFLLLLSSSRGLFEHSVALEVDLRVELLAFVQRVVDQCEAGAAAASELRFLAVDRDVFFLCLLHLAQLLFEVALGHVRELRVDHFDDHLLPGERMKWRV